MKKMGLLFLIIFGFNSSALANNNLGKEIYDHSCQTCHNQNTAPLMRAPTAHDKADWKLRFTDAENLAKKDPKKYPDALAVLIASVKNGKGSMMPGGMCRDNATSDNKCTDADYTAAIKFMSSH